MARLLLTYPESYTHRTLEKPKSKSMKGKFYALRRPLTSLHSLFLPLIFIVFLICTGSELYAKTVIIGTGSGSVTVNGMSGLAPGDILAMTPGNYTGATFSNLNGITITNNGGLVSFSGSIYFTSNINITFIGNGAPGITYGFKLQNIAADAMFTYGNHTSCTWSNMEFVNIGGQAINSQNAMINYDGVNNSTKAHYLCKFLNMHLDHVGSFTNNYKGPTTNVQDSCEYAYITVDNSPTWNQMDAIGLYRGNFHHWILNSNLVHGQNDQGEFIIYGNANIHHMFRTGHHWGWLVRFFHMSLGQPTDIHVYNNVDVGSISYGLCEWRIPVGSIGGNIYVYNNTTGNRQNVSNYTTAIFLSYDSTPGYQAFVANNLMFNCVPGPADATKKGVINFGVAKINNSNFLYYDNPITAGVLQDTVNCYLKAGSPAIDAGVNIPWIKDDLGGVSRPQGNAFDIGGREFNSGAPPPPNQNPIASAGAKQNIYLPTNSATLDGSKSYDPDGSIASYAWTQASGPGTATIANPASATTGISGLVQGTYVFTLTVTDNQGATGKANDTVVVNPPNKAPVANGGGNQTIQLPTNSVSLNGSASMDSDGTIASYLWSQVSGPSASTMGSANAATTTVSNLVQGTYIIKLQVTDNAGATGIAYDTITVKAANKPPVAVAGAKQTITLPANTATLNGSLSSDPDGTIASYSWIQVAGPAGPVIGSPSSATTGVTFTVKGNYVFKLTVTDNQGATGTAYDTITVRPSASSLPVADAGFDQTITLPTSSVNLSGSSSYDSSGTITTYQWSQISGPSTATFGSANAVNTTASGLKQGVYTFQLIITDNNLFSDTDQVNVTVNPAPNQPPVANAGPDQTITLPTSSASLNGTQSADPDGTIASYSWSKVSGPGTPTITSGTTATPVVSGLQAGQYVFQLTVTDNSGASSSDQVTITVNVAPNQPPVANAGTDQVITLPTSSVNLDGTKSYDPDGTIASYSWTRASGPSAPTINNANTATPSITGLQAGVYVFQLTVTDNNGATATDQVTITVNAAANQPPIANAGPDQSIQLPTSSVTLDGSKSSDPDGTIAAYSWIRVSGPSVPTFNNPNIASPSVTGLQAGVYVFQLTVTDNKGAIGSDQVTIIVNPANNQPPVANAGPDQTIQLPTNSVTLDGSKSNDPDGTIASYSWINVSGPSVALMNNPNVASPVATGLEVGVYVFQLTVADNSGAIATDQVTITVLAAVAPPPPPPPPTSQPPVANAGNDTTIALPSNSAILNGSSSSDPNGSITSYQWTETSGPNSATMSSTVSSVSTISDLIVGDYTFELTVMNNSGMISTATVHVRVLDNLKSTEQLVLYPNPAHDVLNVRLISDTVGTLRANIYDMNGKLVKIAQMEKPATFMDNPIDVSRMAGGMYTIQIILGTNKRLVAQFMKQ